MGKKDITKTRSVAVGIPLRFTDPSTSGSTSEPEPLFLVVSSRKHRGRFVFPKGGIESGESPEEAVTREAYEEAGVRVTKLNTLAKDVTSPRTHEGTSVPRACYTVFLTLVDEMLDDWPEIHERDRKWITRDQAQAETHWREEIAASFHLIPSDQELRRMFG